MFDPKILAGNGYTITPILPSGKTPGDIINGHWAPRKDWRQRAVDNPLAPDALQAWQKGAGGVTAGAGIVTGSIVAVDIDISSPELADAAEQTVQSILGKTPLVRIGRPPKRLLVYRTDEPVRKMKSSTWELDGHTCNIEILATGQQFVAFGIHPVTKRPYEWGAHSPLDTPADALPNVTTESLVAVIDGFDNLADMMGATRKYKATLSAGESGDPRGTPQEIRDAMRHIPNETLPYDAWLKFCIAIKRALPDDPDEAFAIFDEFSARYPRYDAQETLKKWESVDLDTRERTVGAGTIYHEARQHGWTGYRTPAEEDFEPIHDQDPIALYLTPADLPDEDPPQREWLIDDLLPLNKTTALTGDGGTGKTLVAQTMATAVALGIPFMGHKARQGRVLAIFTEDDTAELWRRQQAINRALDITMQSLTDFLWMSSDHIVEGNCPPTLMTFTPKSPAGSKTTFFNRLEDMIKALRPALIICDPVANMFAGSEMDRVQVTNFINRVFNYFAVKYGLTVLFLSHPSVSGMQEGTGRSGSTGWANAVRSRLYLSRPEGDETSDIRTLKTTKANYAKLGTEIYLRWQRGAFIQIEGEEARLSTSAEAAVVAALKAASERNEHLSTNPRSPTYLGRRVLNSPEGRKIKKEAVEAAIEDMQRRGVLSVAQIPDAKNRPQPVFQLNDTGYEKPDFMD